MTDSSDTPRPGVFSVHSAHTLVHYLLYLLYMRIIPRTRIATAVAALFLIGAGCLGSSSPTLKPVTLEYWRTQDSPEALADIITAYTKLHPNVTIKVQSLREEDYERTLLEAIAEDRGPDIFSIQNVALQEWKSKVLPLPKETTIATPTVQGDKIVVVNQKSPAMTLLALRDRYVEGIAKELVIPYAEKEATPPTDRIFGLPYSGDTLAMYYNKDLFRKASIEKPPETWADFQPMAARLTIADADGVIRQAGAGIGGANVRYSPDLLAAIMRQNGAVVADEYGYAELEKYSGQLRGVYPPGVESLIFYQSFVTKGAPGYAWNETMPDSLDAFVAGTSAIFFGYPSDAAKIRERAPRLDFAVAPLPQIDATNPKNVLRYPVEVVSRKTKNPDIAWDFIQFAASQGQVVSYLGKTNRPTALRALISTQLQDPAIGPFVGQILTAERWYGGSDITAAEKAYRDLIVARPTKEKPEYALLVSNASNAINATVK